MRPGCDLSGVLPKNTTRMSEARPGLRSSARDPSRSTNTRQKVGGQRPEAWQAWPCKTDCGRTGLLCAPDPRGRPPGRRVPNKITPGMAGGITDKAMAGEDIVALIEATEPKSGNIVEPVDAAEPDLAVPSGRIAAMPRRSSGMPAQDCCEFELWGVTGLPIDYSTSGERTGREA